MYLVDDYGNKIKLEEIEQIDKESKLLFFEGLFCMRESDIEKLEKKLSKKTGCTCVVLDARIGKVFGLR